MDRTNRMDWTNWFYRTNRTNWTNWSYRIDW